MSADPKHYFTLDEYFALEHAGHARYEYWDGDIVCMSGGSIGHSRIAGRIYRRLGDQLEKHGNKCEAFNGEQAIKNHHTTLTPYFYPDVSAVCGKVEIEKIQGIDTITNPILLVEVMSPTSAARDKETKLELYKKIPSLKEYLVVAQDKPEIIQHIKQADGSWISEIISGLTARVELPSIDCTLSLRDIYENIEFP